jgi:predicted DsbA family dithiol-disulfide isomerase
MVTPTLLYFDLVDPLSYLVARELETAGQTLDGADALIWRPFELRPPPTPLTTVSDPTLAKRWSRAREIAKHVAFAPGELVPWTRKAHELLLYAPPERAHELRMRLFEAYLVKGRDIGRVDVLVEAARSLGLDTTETKAVLDVDRYTAEVVEARAEAEAAGIAETPVLFRDGRRLEGFHNTTALGTFLRTPSSQGSQELAWSDDPNSPE